MALGLGRRNHHAWDDAVDTVSRYRDRANDLYDDGLARTADLYHHGRDRAADVYHHGRDRAEDVYDHGRRRAAGIYGESRHRLAGAADALAGRRAVDRGPVAEAAALGVLAGAALVVGVLWLLRRPHPPAVVESTAEQVDDLIAGDGGVTAVPVDTDSPR